MHMLYLDIWDKTEVLRIVYSIGVLVNIYNQISRRVVGTEIVFQNLSIKSIL
jgi:hypothetical protein